MIFKKLSLLLIIFCNLLSIYSQSISQLYHDKYWQYRKRPVNEFLVSGEETVSLQKASDPVQDGNSRRYFGGIGGLWCFNKFKYYN